jgi:hypothetical protein
LGEGPPAVDLIGQASASCFIFSVELPGIELGAKNLLTCRNAEFAEAKRRETT